MKNKKWMFRVIWLLIFLIPFGIGTWGFYHVMDDGILNSMYRAMRLYVTELDCAYSDVTPAIEVARWLAPLVSVTVIFTVLGLFWSHLKDSLRVRKKDAVAIHGDSKYVELLANRLGPQAVVSESPVGFKAGKQVLIFNEDSQMLAYLDEHRSRLLDEKKKVYLCSERIVRGNYRNQNLVLCNFAENCGRQYWKEYPLRLDPLEEQIVIIGFDSYGQEILTQALLMNVYRRDSKITYHVFGDSREYQKLHVELEQFLDINSDQPQRDCVYFHEEPWFESSKLLEEADRIILSDDLEERNLVTLNSLNKYFVIGTVYIKVTNRQILEGLWDQGDGRLLAFGTEEALCTPEMILDEITLDEAKKIHAKYFREYQCSVNKDKACTDGEKNCYKCQELLRDWSSLNSFIRYSNVAQADHIPAKIHLLLGDNYQNIPNAAEEARKKFETLSDEEKMKLCEIEHIRWERYHYMNNWSYAPKRDNKNKKHNLLLPFQELDAKDKVKDEDAWHVAFELYQNPVE